MKQIDIVDYLKVHGCEVKRVDKRGYYVMINPATNKMTGVPLPKEGSEHVMSATIAWICRNLDVPVPDIASIAVPLVEQVRKDHNCDK